MSDHTIMVIWVIKTFFVLVFCVSLPPLLNTSASFRSILFLSFIVPIFSPPFPLVSLIILSHSIVFLYFFAFFLLGRLSYLSLPFLGILHSDGYIYLFFPLLPSASLLFSAVQKASSDKYFTFLHFFSPLGWFRSLPPVH